MPPRSKKASAPPPAEASAPTERPAVQLTDPRDIRALAHPARLAVIDELYSGRELTATECADVAGLSPSAMSYHLRSLEKAGIVERAPSSGDGRERPWRAAGKYLQVEGTSGAGQLAAAAVLSTSLLGRTVGQFEEWLARNDEEPEEWIQASGASYAQLWMTAAEADELENQILELIEKHRGRGADRRPPNARRMRVAMMVFPTDRLNSGTGDT